MKKNAFSRSWTRRPASTLIWAVLLGLLLSTRAQAQVTKRTIGFETACNGSVPTLDQNDILFGTYGALGSMDFAACGISSIVSTSAGLTGGQQRYHDPSGTIAGMSGNRVLAGALDIDLPLTQSNITISFSPAINELSFDVLDLNNRSGLTVTVNTSAGPISSTPMASADGIVHFSTVSVTPITSVVLAYAPVGILDGWYVDQLYINVWSCRDNELENVNGGTEQCDDGNSVACDGCGNDCKTTIDGCLSGTTCVPAGTVPGSFGCATCVVPTPKTGSLQFHPDDNCSSGDFCQVSEKCTAAGACKGTARNCADNLNCTDDGCDSQQTKCTHEIKDGSCLIEGTCFTNGEGNIDDSCERCDRSTGVKDDWSLRPLGSRCGDPSCSDGILTPFPKCSATGLCQTQTPVSCDGAVCADSISCDGACTGDNDCVEETHCVSGVCEPDLPPGMPCERASQCDSNFCVDGVCCGSVCNGPCVSCNHDGSVGTCGPHAAGADPDNDCPDAQFCGGNGMCVGENRPDGSDCESGAECASGFCADGVCCNAACDRSCEACDLLETLGACTPYIAGTDPEMECPAAQRCSAPGVCAPENRPNGTECTEDAYCASGHCADGLCCNLACDGTCEACNSAEQPGVCTPFAAGTDPANECSGDAVCSGEGACVSYETRGNGLCSVGFGTRGSAASLAGLLALCALLRARRRSKR